MWYSVGSAAYMFGMWVITFLVVILSNESNAGMLGIAMSVTNVLYTVSIWGMRAYQVSDLQGKFSDNTYIMSRLLTCGVSLVACIGFVAIKGYSLTESGCIILYMVFKVSEALVDVLNGIVQKHWRMDIIGKSYIARMVLTVASFSVVLKLTGSLLLSIIAMMICSFSVILSYDLVQTIRIASLKIRLDFRGTDKLLLICAPLIVCAFLYSFNVLVPRMIVEDTYGKAVFGCYSSIAAPVLIIQLLASFIYAPLIPLFSKSHTENNTRAFTGLLLKTVLVLSLLSGAALLGFYFLGDWGLNILYGSKPQVLSYSYLLVPTVLTVICTAFIWLLNNVITAIRQIKLLFFSAIVGSVVCVAISGPCIDAYGVNGINVSMIIVQAVQIVLMAFIVIRYIFKGREQEKQG